MPEFFKNPFASKPVKPVELSPEEKLQKEKEVREKELRIEVLTRKFQENERDVLMGVSKNSDGVDPVLTRNEIRDELKKLGVDIVQELEV